MTTGARPHPETTRFILELTRLGPEHLIADGHQMDAKAFQVLGVASAIIGLVAFAFADGSGALVTTMLFVATASYLAAVAAVFMVVKRRVYAGSDYATTLWRDFWEDSVEEITWSLASDIPAAFKHNADVNNEKARWMERASAAIAIETIVVAAAVLASRL